MFWPHGGDKWTRRVSAKVRGYQTRCDWELQIHEWDWTSRSTFYIVKSYFLDAVDQTPYYATTLPFCQTRIILSTVSNKMWFNNGNSNPACLVPFAYLQLSITPSLVSADFCAHMPSSVAPIWPKHEDKKLPNLQQWVDKIIGKCCKRTLDLLRGQVFIYHPQWASITWKILV